MSVQGSLAAYKALATKRANSLIQMQSACEGLLTVIDEKNTEIKSLTNRIRAYKAHATMRRNRNESAAA